MDNVVKELPGILTIKMWVVISNRDEPVNPEKDRMRKVTLMRHHSVYRHEAYDVALRFLTDNALMDERKHQVEITWQLTEPIFPHHFR
jgi:hypothetical protein